MQLKLRILLPHISKQTCKNLKTQYEPRIESTLSNQHDMYFILQVSYLNIYEEIDTCT